MSIRNAKREELRRIESKTLDAQFKVTVQEGPAGRPKPSRSPAVSCSTAPLLTQADQSLDFSTYTLLFSRSRRGPYGLRGPARRDGKP